MNKKSCKRKLREIAPYSLTVTVPSHLCQKMGLIAGTYLEFGTNKGSIVMKPETQRQKEIK